MRVRNAALLAFPAAFLSCLVHAVPSPSTHFDDIQHHEQQQPLLRHASGLRSQWWDLSHRLVETLFGPPTDNNGKEIKKMDADKRVPSHLNARYGDQVVLRFNISTHEEAQSLAEAADILLLDVWEYAEDWVDIRLSKDIVGPLLGLLPFTLQESHKPLLAGSDLAQAIHATYQQTFAPPNQGNIFFSDYQPLPAIEAWMRLFASFFSTHVRTLAIGNTHEGRPISGLRIGVQPAVPDPDAAPRQTILVLGGLHAREWISTSSALYAAYGLITAYGKDPRITHLLQTFDVVVLPTVNPDGYVYTWDVDRLWRKNRQPTSFRFCPGIDLDRSFGFQWSSSSSSNPCSEAFAGDAPFAATEARALADWARNETIVGMLDLHSYSQQILYPYSYTCDAEPPGLENLEELGFGLGKAIRLSEGRGYEVMSACEGNSVLSKKDGRADAKKDRLFPRMEGAGGSALDWFYHDLQIHYAYQIKLRDRGSYGFLLPKEQIIPTGKEVLNALLYFAGFVGQEMVGDGFGLLDLTTPELEGEQNVSQDVAEESRTSAPAEEEADAEAEDWVWVTDDDLDPNEPQWDLRRRRRK